MVGQSLDPDIVTRVLDVAPTKYWRRGDRVSGEIGSPRERDSGLWSFAVTVSLSELTNELRYFSERFKGDVPIKERISEVQYCRLAIFSSSVHTIVDTFRLRIDADTLKIWADLGVDFEVEAIVAEE